MASELVSSTRVPFLILTVAAFALLQGTLLANGSFVGLLKAVWYGQFENGKPLHRIYTGLPVVDEVLAVSVSFWDVVATKKPILRLQSVMLCASLQTFAVFATVEWMRKGHKHTILRWAPIYVFCWQYTGTAIFLPFYFYTELNQHFDALRISDPGIPYFEAKSLIPAAVLTAIHPYLMVYFPWPSTTTAQHQTFIAAYQLGPFICYSVVTALANYLSSNRKREQPQVPDADAKWIKATYAFFGVFSAVAHVAVLGFVWSSQEPSLSPSEIFMPRAGKMWSPNGAASLYAEQFLFFLQWDFILIVMGGSLYVTRILEGISSSEEAQWSAYKRSAVLLVSGIGSVVLSPGLLVSLALYGREDFLRVSFAQKQSKQKRQLIDDKKLWEGGRL